MRQQIKVKLREKIISIICFADNILIITESEGGVQRDINAMEDMLKACKIKIQIKI